MANYTAVADDASALVAEKKSWMAQNRAAAAALGVSGALLLALAVFYATSRSSDVFFEDFHSIDAARWTVERSLDDGGNGEFQAPRTTRRHLHANGRLVIQPKPMSADAWYQLSGLDAKLEDPATPDADKCAHAGKWDEPLPPVVSARLSSKGKFQFRHGRVEARLRLPVGDWVWPAFWLLPAENAYGPWPFSGEIDLLEARGNDADFEVVGSSQSGKAGFDRLAATVHCADAGGGDTFSIGNTTIWPSQSNNFKALEDADGFVIIGLDWRPGSVRTYAREGPGLAQERTLATWPGAKGPYCENDACDGHPDAPFDAEFYFVINVAVGGSAGGGVAYWGEDVLWKGCDHPHMCDPRTAPTRRRPGSQRGPALEVDWIA
ncbi:glycosyl hydrolase [Aureococcus anophagefferens]|nr:glycosyl hydrolase [Aureococcus anophagefferens]